MAQRKQPPPLPSRDQLKQARENKANPPEIKRAEVNNANQEQIAAIEAELGKAEKTTHSVLVEFFQTERSFRKACRELSDVVAVSLGKRKPDGLDAQLKASVDSKLNKKDFEEYILPYESLGRDPMGNVDLQKKSSKDLTKLLKKLLYVEAVGQPIGQKTPYFTATMQALKSAVEGQSRFAAAILRSKNNNFQAKANSVAIMPTQRGPRYDLLLTEIIKRIDKERLLKIKLIPLEKGDRKNQLENEVAEADVAIRYLEEAKSAIKKEVKSFQNLEMLSNEVNSKLKTARDLIDFMMEQKNVSAQDKAVLKDQRAILDKIETEVKAVSVMQIRSQDEQLALEKVCNILGSQKKVVDEIAALPSVKGLEYQERPLAILLDSASKDLLLASDLEARSQKMFFESKKAVQPKIDKLKQEMQSPQFNSKSKDYKQRTQDKLNSLEAMKADIDVLIKSKDSSATKIAKFQNLMTEYASRPEVKDMRSSFAKITAQKSSIVKELNRFQNWANAMQVPKPEGAQADVKMAPQRPRR